MVKHIIIFKLKSEYSDAQKNEIKANAKAALEALKGKVPGLTEIKIITNGLDSSSADILLDSTFVDEEALKGYQVHPDHVAAATNYVRPFYENRYCIDYEV